MVLTPDQKKRIAALDASPPEPEEDTGKPSRLVSARVKSRVISARASSLPATAVKILVAIALVAMAGYFLVANQIHQIDFKAVLSSGRGSPVTRLSNAIKLQRQKVEMLEKGRGHLLVGEHDEAFETALAVEKLDPNDSQCQLLIDDTVDTVTQMASRKMESGEIEAALVDVRTALKYRPAHGTANELYKDIADRLMLEAQEHYSKGEYPKLIKKAQEVVRIGKDPSNMAAYNLLNKTSNELLDDAEESYAARRYFDALGNVQLSLKIDPSKKTNSTAHGLLKRISDYIGEPKLELRGIIKKGATTYARIYLPDEGKVEIVKKGGIIKGTNIKVIDINPKLKQVHLAQIHTGRKSTLKRIRPE